MPSWYLGKIKYQQEQENGSLKQISESYLIDAVSYTDAEARLYAVVADNTPDFSIASLGPMKLSDVFEFKDDDGQLDGEIYFKVKTYYESLDDTKSNPVAKKIASTMLVNAHSPKEAIERIEKSLATMLIPYFITDVNTTAILEVHPYVAEEKPREIDYNKEIVIYDDEGNISSSIVRGSLVMSPVEEGFIQLDGSDLSPLEIKSPTATYYQDGKQIKVEVDSSINMSVDPDLVIGKNSSIG